MHALIIRWLSHLPGVLLALTTHYQSCTKGHSLLGAFLVAFCHPKVWLWHSPPPSPHGGKQMTLAAVQSCLCVFTSALALLPGRTRIALVYWAPLAIRNNTGQQLLNAKYICTASGLLLGTGGLMCMYALHQGDIQMSSRPESFITQQKKKK